MTPEEKLHTHGLTPADAHAIGIVTLSPEETVAQSPTFIRPNLNGTASLKFVYRDLRGRDTGFYRLRYLTPPNDPRKHGKTIKFCQAGGSLTGIYLPGFMNWQEISLLNSRQVFLVEGEGKAACAAKLGLAAIGLGGVDAFQSSRYEIELLDPLPMFNWKDRSVVICFDSDVRVKPDVIRAQTKLASLLTNKGARVVITQIPNPPPDSGDDKWGLDDYLLHSTGGLDAFEDLLAESLPPSEARELWSMNSEYAAVMKPPAVMNMNEGQLMEPTKFQSFHLANRFYYQDQPTKSGHIIRVKEKIAPRWLEWEERRQFRKLVYEPGQPETISVGDKHDLNLWPGWAVEPEEPTLAQIAPWNELLDFIFASEPGVRPWFEQWLAYPLQNPGGKLFSYVLLWSPLYGIGKTMIPYIMMDIYGRSGKWGAGNSIEIKNEDLAGTARFPIWQLRKQFVYGDEITGKDTRKGAGYIKGLITAEELTVEEKYIQAYTIRNLVNFMFSSNAPDAMFIDANDRRPLIHEVWGPRPPDGWYQRLADWRRDGGAKYVFHHLLHLDMGGFEPKFAPPNTAAKKNMARLSMTEAGQWVDAMREDPVEILGRCGVSKEKAEGCDLWTTAQLLNMYDPMQVKRVGEIGMGKQLAMLGIRPVNRGNVLRMSTGSHRILALRNIHRWMEAMPGEIRDHWERWHGKPEADDE